MKQKGILSLKSSNTNNSEKLLSDKFKSFSKNRKQNRNNNDKSRQNDGKVSLNENEKQRRLNAINNLGSSNAENFQNLMKSQMVKKNFNNVAPKVSVDVPISKKLTEDKKKKFKEKLVEKVSKVDKIEKASDDVKKNKKNTHFEPTSVDEIFYDDELKDLNLEKAVLNFVKKPKKQKKIIVSKNQKSKFIAKSILVSESGIFCSDLAHRMQVELEVVIEAAESLTGNKNIEKLNREEAEIIIKEFGHKPILNEIDHILYDPSEKKDTRPPIISIMGHVDHGKTSIIDRMRKTTVVNSEFGGITQKVSAYSFEKNGKKMTLIDTPGHEIFKEMRVNGAKFTDIVLLVVAADDGVKEQTIESIKYAKQSNAAIIVVINKIDKKGVDRNKIKRELMNNDILVESMGGEIIEAEVSAKTGEGFDKLYELIFLQADILELKTNNESRANGVIIDSYIDKGKGIVTTVIVKDGMIKNKDFFICNKELHRVKSLFVDNKRFKESLPSSTISILGFNKIVNIGDTFHVIENEKQAKLAFIEEAKEEEAQIERKISFLKKKNLYLIVKGSTAAAISAITEGINGLKNADIDVKVLYSSVGDINEGDVVHASTFGAKILGFFVKNDYKGKDIHSDVDIKIYNIIYELIDDIKSEIKRIIGDKFREELVGAAKITHIFDMKDSAGKAFRVAGGIVTSNTIINEPGIVMRIKRNNNVIIQEGLVKSLEMRRISVTEVKERQEFGIALKDHHNMEVGDIIECVRKIKIN